MDQTSALLLALVVFAEIAVLVIQNQHCIEAIQKKRAAVDSKKSRLSLRIQALEEENHKITEQIDALRNQVDASEA